MTRSQRLKPVVRVTQAREQDLARRWNRALGLWRAHQARLEELERHRTGYEDVLRRECARGVDAARLQHYQRFLERLAEAIAVEQRRVAELERACQEACALWQAARQRRRAFDQVAQRYAHAERQAEERREQRESDDRTRHGRNAEER